MLNTDEQGQRQQSLSVAILAGGMSRRMGTDKALLSLRPGDPPFLAATRDRVRAISDDVFVIATNRPQYAQFGMPLVQDAVPEGGALGGILTALRHARHDHCLVIPCDLPFLNLRLLTWMASQPRDYDVLIPYLPGESRQGHGYIYQTLHAIYGRACLPAIEEHLTTGRKQVIGFFDEVYVRRIDESTVRSFDPDLRSFFNANTPEALASARAIAAEIGGDR
ncbi:MAG TPA: molybdenum cofactor guanylyltransferase [Thermomicrobiales bacterium]|nr:molybdenum cofactor guanylyltransferase [Thermomicrobiales bacterium]